jgi:molybdopterin converting factor small subunit
VPSIRLPSLLAQEAGGIRRHEVEAATVREALAALPVGDLLIDELGRLRPLVCVYVDGEREHDLGAELEPGAEIILVAAVAGGAR